MSSPNVNSGEPELFGGKKKTIQKSLSHLKGQLGKSRRNKGREKVRTEGQTDRQTDGEAGVGFLGGAHILTEGTDRA